MKLTRRQQIARGIRAVHEGSECILGEDRQGYRRGGRVGRSRYRELVYGLIDDIERPISS